MCYLERNTDSYCVLFRAQHRPRGYATGVPVSYSWPADLPYCTCTSYSLQLFSVIVDASKPTSQYNRANAYDCAVESEAVAHASCVEIFVCPLCANLSNLFLCKFLSVRYSGVNLYCPLCNTVFISVRIPDYRGVCLSGVSLNTLST